MTPMSDAEYRRQTDDAFRAVGRYVVVFSQLIGRMRNTLAERLSEGRTVPPAVPELALGEATAQQIAVAFFSICRFIGQFDKSEQKIEAKLRNEVNAIIEKRNDVAHGDWWIGFAPYDADRINLPTLVRIRPLRADFEKVVELSAADLDAQSDDVVQLINILEEYGRIALGMPVLRDPQATEAGLPGVSTGEYRVRDIYEKAAGKDAPVLRTGPKASELALITYLHP
jgi:hypothetical protein